VITQLVSEGLIEVHPGWVPSSPSVSRLRQPSGAICLKKELEQLVVEAKKLGLDLDQFTEAVTQHWGRLDGTDKAARRKE